MAYHLTGTKAHLANAERKLKPVKIGTGLYRYVQDKPLEFEDSCGRLVRLPVGHLYRITGTRDGNGYVVTFDEVDRLNGTRYLTASVGSKLL